MVDHRSSWTAVCDGSRPRGRRGTMAASRGHRKSIRVVEHVVHPFGDVGTCLRTVENLGDVERGAVGTRQGAEFARSGSRLDNTSHDRTARRAPHAKCAQCHTRGHPQTREALTRGLAGTGSHGYGCGSLGKYPWVTRAIPYCGGGGSGPLASFMSNPSLIRTFIRLPGR